jgi:hypothetical protein
MSITPGSSSIPIYGIIGNPGPTGATGPTGPVGPQGFQGDCLDGNTGIGISGITKTEQNLIITYGTAGSTLGIQNSVLKGNTGTVEQNLSVFNIKGTTTTGQHIFQTFTPQETTTRSVTFSADPDALKIPTFLGLTFVNISVNVTDDLYEISNFSDSTNYSGASGQLVFVDQFEDKFTIRGASGTLWNQDVLKYKQKYSKELDTFASGSSFDNYTSTSLSQTAVTGGWQEGGVTYIIPVTSLVGNTAQSNLIIKDQKISFAPTNHSSGMTANLLVGGATLGSCFVNSIQDPRKKCVDFMSEPYCKSIGGIWSLNPCSEREEIFTAIKTCCIYSYETDEVICIETFESECLQFMGIPGNLNRCAVYEDIMKKCSDLGDLCLVCAPGKCCYKGNCTNETEFQCITGHPGAVWFAGETC